VIRKLALLVVLLTVAVPAFADFRDVERELRTRLGSPIYIPFLGFARFATWMVHPHGVRDFQLATWEDKHAVIDGVELEQLLRRGLPPDFQPVVRVRERHEWTFIYARPVGDRFEMMLLTHDDSDTVLVRADINGEQLAKAIQDHRVEGMK
jgi:hypothetical protein